MWNPFHPASWNTLKSRKVVSTVRKGIWSLAPWYGNKKPPKFLFEKKPPAVITELLSRWWFQIFLYFHPEPWGRFPFSLIFFKGVETTNQLFFSITVVVLPCFCWLTPRIAPVFFRLREGPTSKNRAIMVARDDSSFPILNAEQNSEPPESSTKNQSPLVVFL